MSDQGDRLQQAGAGALALSDSLSTVRQAIATASCSSIAEMVTATVSALMSHQDIDGCAICIGTDASGRSGSSKAAGGSSDMPPVLESWLLTEVLPAMVAGVYREPFLDRRSADSKGCVLAAPIGKGDGVVGSLAVWNERPNHFLPWHETLLEMIADVLLLTLSCQPAGYRQAADEQVPENEVACATAPGPRPKRAGQDRTRVLDPLTGLSDRQSFELRLHELTAIPMPDSRSCFVLYIDIDRFHLVREYGGYLTAERVMRTLAEVLQRETDAELALGRLGMDEFGVVVERHSLEQAVAMAGALVDQVDAFRMTYAGQRFHVSISIGVAELVTGMGGGDTALRQAREACRAAQSLGGGAVQIYHERLVERHSARNDGWMLNRLTHALKNDGLKLYAQSISPLCTDNEDESPLLHMHEVLLRLRDEDGQICTAGTFLPVAERYGLSVKLDRWVIQSAFRQIARSPFAEDSRHRFSLNLSGHSIDNSRLLEFIMQQFDASGLSPERICFEITETAAITDVAAAKEFVEALRRIGCQFALDDFGSGHSSFLYLRDLPVDYLKIDGELVRETVDDPVSLAFVRTIEGIGRLMGRRTIAECVESQEIYNTIGAIGCDYAQGYWVGCPVPIADVLSKPRS